jgi:hypothetical protein
VRALLRGEWAHTVRPYDAAEQILFIYSEILPKLAEIPEKAVAIFRIIC